MKKLIIVLLPFLFLAWIIWDIYSYNQDLNEHERKCEKLGGIYLIDEEECIKLIEPSLTPEPAPVFEDNFEEEKDALDSAR